MVGVIMSVLVTTIVNNALRNLKDQGDQWEWEDQWGQGDWQARQVPRVRQEK